MKQVCVIGLGQFGSHLARKLASLGCEVLAIDTRESAVAAIRDDVQRAVITDARDLEALKSVVTAKIDEAVVSLGESIESSVLCTLHLHQIGVKLIRSKAKSEDHASILKAVGATEVIFPERETAERMAQRIINPDLLEFLPLSEEYRVVELSMPESFPGKSLAELHLRKKYNILVIALRMKDTKQLLFMPPADTVLAKRHSMLVIGKQADIAALIDEK